jgi:hypothetical protein
MRKAIVIGFFSLLLGSFNVHGEDIYDDAPFSHWAAGINAGLYGVGLEANTHLLPNVQLRLGFNYFGLKLNTWRIYDYDYEEKNPQYGYITEKQGNADLTPKIGLVHGKILFDILPFKTGIFAFTTGVYIGKTSLSVDGKAFDEYGPISGPMTFDGGIVVYPDSKGNVDATLRFGNIVKPYFGLTVGRAIPNHRVGVKFDLGVVYQGNLKLESNNSSNDSGINRAKYEISSTMSELPSAVKDLIKIWPMMQLQLTYRIN